MKYRIEISLKSFEHDLLVRATKQIQHIMPKEMSKQTQELKPVTSADRSFQSHLKAKIFYFPVQVQKLTVLRSPHIDKKARDQFEIRRFKNIVRFDINHCQGALVESFLENLKNIHCAGIQIKIKISSQGFAPEVEQSRKVHLGLHVG